MSFRIILGVAALACAAICAIASSFVTFEMADRVNERLPESQQFSLIWWYCSKYWRLLRAYKNLYPDGPLLKMFWVLAALMFACLLVCIWAVRIVAR